MRFAIITAWKDLLRVLRDPFALIAWMAMPAIITGLITLIFQTGGGPLPQGKLLVADEDKTLPSAALYGVFNREPLKKMIVVETVDYEHGRKHMDTGDASALLVIPKGFGDAFFRGRSAKVTLLTNPAQRILPGIIQQALATTLDQDSYVQMLLAGGPGQPDLQAVNRLSRQFAAYVNPPLIDVKTALIEQREKPVSFPALFYPGMLLLAIFGFAQSMSEDVWRERSFGAIRRVLATSSTLGEFLGGKIAALALVFGAVAGAGIVAARFVLSVPMHNLVLSTVWVAGSGVGLYLMATLLQVFSTEQRAGVVLNGFVLFLFSMVGGSIFPFEVMPKWMASIGRFTPNGWAIQQFKELIAGPVDAGRAAGEFAILAAFGVIAFFFLVRRLRRWAV